MSTAFYEGHDIPTCPNGDKLRSDEEGLFCIVDGERVAAELVNGEGRIKPIAAAKTKAVKDGNG